jgi:hypothetical protein
VVSSPVLPPLTPPVVDPGAARRSREPGLALGVYRPRPGCAAELRRLLEQHQPLLLDEGLVAARPWLLLAGADGGVIEVFAWRPEAARRAFLRPRVAALWEAIARAAEHSPLVRHSSGRLFPRLDVVAWEP